MTELPPGFADDDACIRARIGIVALILSREVNRLRALRGDGREERFAGVLMRDADVAALCAGLISDPLPGFDDLDAAIDVADERYQSRLNATPRIPRLERIKVLYNLSAFEFAVLTTCLAAAIDPRLARVLGYLNEDMAQQHLTIGLSQRLFGGTLSDNWRGLSDEGTLLRHGLIDRVGPVSGNAALALSPAALDAIVLGPNQEDRATVLPFEGTRHAEGPMLIEAANAPDALVFCHDAGPLWIADGGYQSVSDALRLGLHAALCGETHWLMGWDSASAADRQALVNSLGAHAVLVTSRPALWDGLGLGWAREAVPPATVEDLRTTWGQIAHPDFAALLSEERTASPAKLWRLAQEAHDPDGLSYALGAARSNPMHGLADLVRSDFTLDDLEVPRPIKSRLTSFSMRREQDAQVLEEWGLGSMLGAGRGAVALFLGPSGVGKTMAAGAVAKAANLALWRVNLATVVSKYIGETEANLDRIFAAADKADVMLFFDEAEALFSKRADVKDARDRYANMEMAYLLQRIEDFHGMAVLASNMGASLEPAMLRRFDLVLDFPLPDEDARRRIWGRIAQTKAPLASDVDLDDLAARFDLSGGHIRQAMLGAAHAAAVTGQLTQRDLMQAVAREYAKLDRPIRKEEFGPHFADVRGLS